MQKLCTIFMISLLFGYSSVAQLKKELPAAVPVASAIPVKFALSSNTATNTVLPLTFSSFTGSNINCLAFLKWVTTTEISFSYFSIEASTDGNVFKEIERVKSLNSDVGGSYSTNASLDSDTNFYRVLAMDLSGRNVTSTNIIILKNICMDNAKISVYPNPTTDNVTVSGLKGNKSLSVVNAKGQEMAKFTSSTFTQVIPVSSYPSGIYLIKIVNENGSFKVMRFIRK